LTCPYLPPQPNPAAANFNPYVTVDYMDQVPCFDGVTNDQGGAHTAPAGQQKASVGRNQPYAADVSQQIQQFTNPAPTAPQPQNTFFQINTFQANQFNNPAAPNNPGYGWLFFADRNVVSSMELLNVSGFKPHLLTQMFVNGAGTYQHRAPWFDEDLLKAGPANTSHRLYRFFDYAEGGNRFQRCPIGGRMPGKININTIWDPETFNAMGDYQGINLFTQAGVTGVYNRMTASRTPGGSPGAADAPFWGFSTGPAPAGDPQYPNQNGINLTLFRPLNAASPAGQRVLEPNPGIAGGEYRGDRNNADVSGVPYYRFELMNKIANTITTRSNVFAVYLTVGFFEVDAAGNLGAEIGAAEGRAIRHRTFSIVDRSALTVDIQKAAGAPQPNLGTAGQPPFFLESLSAVSAAGPASVNVPLLSGNYDGLPWSIAAGNWLVVDSGQNQEVVNVTGVGANSFTAAFTKTHPNGFCIGNALPGHPGRPESPPPPPGTPRKSSTGTRPARKCRSAASTVRPGATAFSSPAPTTTSTHPT
jgi:hypothetical protein